MLVPSNTANGPPEPAVVEERICPPGAARSGLSRCPKAVGPAEEKLVTTPLRPVASPSGVRPIRTGARPPDPARYARSRSPSMSAIIPPGSERLTGISFASPARLSTITIPIAPASFARRAFEANVHSPRETSASVPASAPGRSGPGPPFGFAAPPQSRRPTGAPSPPTSEPTSTRAWSAEPHSPGALPPAAPTKGIPRRLAGAPVTSSAGAKTRSFETAATAIASGAVPGEPAEPAP